MRQHLAFLALGLFGGCSLIFNPDNIHKPIDAKDLQDVPLDVEVIADADLSMPELSEVYPATVYEGVGVTETGTGVGTPAVLVLRGHNFCKGSERPPRVVTLTPDSGGMLVIDDTQIARDGNFIALAVTSPIDAACHDGGSHNVTISVQQDNGTGGTAMAPPLVGALTITCLDELTASPASASALKPRYSKVDITGNLTFPPNESPNTTAIVQSMSFIKVTGNVTADASAAGPGPGGCAGGTAGATPGGGPGGPGACAGGGGGGTGSGGGGGGGGFTAAGSGGARQYGRRGRCDARHALRSDDRQRRWRRWRWWRDARRRCRWRCEPEATSCSRPTAREIDIIWDRSVRAARSARRRLRSQRAAAAAAPAG